MGQINFNYWFLQTVAMMLTALAIPGLRITGPVGALGTVVSVAFINSHIWDAALFFRIPQSLSNDALLLFLSNGVIFWVLIKLLPGIEVKGILPALCAPVIFSICSALIFKYGSQIDWLKVLDFCIQELTRLKNYFMQTSPNLAHTPVSS